MDYYIKGVATRMKGDSVRLLGFEMKMSVGVLPLSGTVNFCRWGDCMYFFVK